MPASPHMPDRLLDPGLAVLIAGVALLELQLPGMTGDGRAAVVILLYCAPVAIRRWSPLAALVILAGVGSLSPSFTGSFPSTPGIATALVFYSVAAFAGWRFRLALGVVAFLALEATVGIRDDTFVPLFIGAWGPYWLGRQVRSRREMVEVLAERAREIEAEEDAFTRLSVRRERARIARELHDIVSHHLAMIVVQAGAGRMASSGGPERAVTRFAAIRSAGDQALSELARLLDVLHAEHGESRDRLRSLLDQAMARGLPLRVTLPPTTIRLPAEVEDVAYRVVQEGLTNAVKHAPGSEVDVRVTAADDELEVALRDSGGAGSSLATTGSGLGLAGMRERVEALGGRLEAGPAPGGGGGWSVHAWLPLGAPVAVGAAAAYPGGMT